MNNMLFNIKNFTTIWLPSNCLPCFIDGFIITILNFLHCQLLYSTKVVTKGNRLPVRTSRYGSVRAIICIRSFIETHVVFIVYPLPMCTDQPVPVTCMFT